MKDLTGKGGVEDSSNNQDEDDEFGGTTEEDVMAAMGFASFGSTKGKQVDCNKETSAVGTVSKHKKRVYRQYMNRKGGFNRPLQKLN